METYYDRLGDILRDRLNSDDDPFDFQENVKSRQAGNMREKIPRPLRKTVKRIAVPGELVEYFTLLGILPGVPADECKAAWKKKLMEHHPDKKAQNPKEQQKSNLMTSRLNEAYRKIMRWYETGSLS